jgi:putative peptidoglycan lipid II flippase
VSIPEPGSGSDREIAQVAQTAIARSSAVVAVGTALSRVTGFARIAAIAYALGVTTLAGTYSYANEAPNIVYELLLGGVFTATLVPLFVRHLDTREDDSASAVFTVAMLVLAGTTVVGIILAPWIVHLYTLNAHGPGLAEQRDLATKLLRLFLPQILFYGIVTLASALLNARRRFAAAAFAPVLNNVVVIAVFLVLPEIATGSLTVHSVLADDTLVLLMGLGTTAGVAVMALALIPPLWRADVHLRYDPAWRHPAVRTMLRLSGWTVGYVIANQIALLVVTILANGTSGGPFVYISAYAFFQLPHGLVAVSFMTTFMPELSHAAARGDLVTLRRQLSRGLRLTAVFIGLFAGLYVGLARPLVVVLLQRGAFTGTDASLLADTIVGMAVGLLPFSLYLFSLRAFYARNDTFTPFWVNAVENALNIALAIPLYDRYGIPGLAVAFSAAYLAACGLSLAVVRARLRGLDGSRLTRMLSRAVLAGTATAATGWVTSKAIGWEGGRTALLSLIVGGLLGAVAYAAVLRMTRPRHYRPAPSPARRAGGRAPSRVTIPPPRRSHPGPPHRTPQETTRDHPRRDRQQL